MLVAKVTVDWNSERFEKDLEQKIESGLDRAAEKYVSIAKRSLSASNQGGANPSPPGQPPHSETRNLANSITWMRAGMLRRQMGSNWPYALIHEIGGVITPKNAGALTIPVSRKARRFNRSGGSAREFPIKLSRVNRPGLPGLLVEKIRGNKARWIIHYVLAESVRLPARPYLRPALYSDEYRTFLRRVFGA